MVLPRTGRTARDGARVEDPGEVERDRARPRAHLPPGLLGADRAALPGAGADRGARRPDEELERLQGPAGGGQRRLPRGGPRRALAPHGDPGRQDRELPALPADAVERAARATSTGLPAPTRTRCRTRRSSRRTARRTSRASTSCGRCGASTRACRAACTCTPAAGQVRKVHAHADRDVLSAATEARGNAAPSDPSGQPRGADRAGPGADRARSSGSPTRRPRELAEELRRRGDRAVRRGPGADRRDRSTSGEAPARSRERLAEDGVVASLLLIHDLYPVAARGAGASRRSTACGPTWSRTAATSSCSGSRTASPGCGSRAAATAARPRRRRWSWRSRRRSRRRRPTSRASRSRARSQADAGGADRRDRAAGGPGRRRRRGAAAELGVARARRRRRPRRGRARQRRGRRDALIVANGRGHAARLPRRLRRLRRAARRRRARATGVLACPRCERRFFLPRAGRSLDDERLQLEPVPLLARRGRRQGGAAPMSDGARRRRSPPGGGPTWSSSLRRLPPAAAAATGRRRRRPPAPRSAATCAATAIPPTTATCSHLDERRILCVCATCWALRSRRPGAAGRPARGRSGSRTSSSPTSSGRAFADPDRAGVLHALAAPTGGVVALYPSPAGATESRARPRGLGRSCAAANPVLDDARARRRGADRQPHRRAAAATRSRRSTSATGWSALIKASWEGISGGAAVERAVPRLLRASCAARA